MAGHPFWLCHGKCVWIIYQNIGGQEQESKRGQKGLQEPCMPSKTHSAQAPVRCAWKQGPYGQVRSTLDQGSYCPGTSLDV